jgi:hypothetical protein
MVVVSPAKVNLQRKRRKKRRSRRTGRRRTRRTRRGRGGGEEEFMCSTQIAFLV